MSWRLFWQNGPKIVTGVLQFILCHPLACWHVLWARLYCVFKPYHKIVHTPEGLNLCGFGQIYVYFQLFVEQTLYHKGMLRAFATQESPFVIDVGANVGLFSQWLSKWHRGARFHAFEPSFEAYMVHRHFSDKTNLDVKLFPCAVSNKNDIINTIRYRRLDSLYAAYPIFLLKIDTDGHNLEVLEGAGSLLGCCRYVLIEKESDYSSYFVPELGWKCTDLGNDLLYEQTLQ